MRKKNSTPSKRQKENMKSRQKAWRNHRTKYSVSRVHRHLIFGCIANEALCISEGDIARCRSVTLVISNDLHSVMLPHAYTTVSRSQIDSDSRSFTLTGHDSESSENNTRSPLLQKTTKKKRLYDDNNAKRNLCNEAENVLGTDSDRKNKSSPENELQGCGRKREKRVLKRRRSDASGF